MDGSPAPVEPPSSTIDPFSRAFFDDPHCYHAELRDLAPVVRLSHYDIHVVARHAEVHAMLMDWETYCSSRGVGISDFKTETPWRPPSLILEADPPAHTGARSVLARILSAAAMKQLRDRFSVAAADIVERLLARGRIDGIADLAEAYPLEVFPDAVGMPRENRGNLLPYGGIAFNAFGPRNALLEEALAHGTPYVAWVNQQVRRESLDATGFGAQIHAAADAGEISHAEAPLLVRSLLTAGVDTTVNGLGAALYCMARFPDQWDLLRADPKLARAAFEEAIRFESPVQTFFRTTTRDVEIAGFRIAEGRKVLMLLASANRDPRRWEDPDRYDITRRTNGHVGFGAGIHMCVGQLLARLEGEVLLAALAKRVGRIELSGEPTRRYNNTLRGLATLPLTLHPN